MEQERITLFFFLALVMVVCFNFYNNDKRPHHEHICYSLPNPSLYSEATIYDNNVTWDIIMMRHDDLITILASSLEGHCNHTLKTATSELLPLEEPHFPIATLYDHCRDCTKKGPRKSKVLQYQKKAIRNLSQFYGHCWGCGE